MADLRTVARPYAKAVFAVAKEDNTLAVWQEILSVLALIMSAPEVTALINDPKVTEQQTSQLIESIIEKVTSRIPQETQTKLNNFLNLLRENKRLNALIDINAIYQELLAEHEAVVNVEVVSAEPLTSKQIKHIGEVLKQKFARDVSLHFSEDQTLIGGVLLRAGNWVLDDSIKSKLARLDESLMK